MDGCHVMDARAYSVNISFNNPLDLLQRFLFIFSFWCVRRNNSFILTYICVVRDTAET